MATWTRARDHGLGRGYDCRCANMCAIQPHVDTWTHWNVPLSPDFNILLSTPWSVFFEFSPNHERQHKGAKAASTKGMQHQKYITVVKRTNDHELDNKWNLLQTRFPPLSNDQVNTALRSMTSFRYPHLAATSALCQEQHLTVSLSRNDGQFRKGAARTEHLRRWKVIISSAGIMERST